MKCWLLLLLLLLLSKIAIVRVRVKFIYVYIIVFSTLLSLLFSSVCCTLKSDNCKKGMFEELQSYRDDEIGALSSSDLKECTIEFHEKIVSHVKGLKENKYLDLVS